jgi:hypothetical protein
VASGRNIQLHLRVAGAWAHRVLGPIGAAPAEAWPLGPRASSGQRPGSAGAGAAGLANGGGIYFRSFPEWIGFASWFPGGSQTYRILHIWIFGMTGIVAQRGVG